MKGLLCAVCAGLALGFAEDVMRAVEQAAQVFAAGVMPALFPMMILTRMLPCEGRAATLPGAAAFSFASGSPASAQRVSLLWQAGKVPRGWLAPLLGVCGVMSPMFFVGTLAGWTGLRGAMWAMLGIHWLGALVTAGVLRLGAMFASYRRVGAGALSCRRGRAGALRGACAAREGGECAASGGCPRAQGAQGTEQGGKPPCTLTAAVSASAQALLAVCGAMMLFSAVAGVARAAARLLLPPAWSARPLAVLWALMEIGGGAKAVLEEWPQPPLALLSFLCGFGGLSICLQNLLFVGACVRPAKLLMIRLLHGAICAGLCALVFSGFPPLRQAFAAGAATLVPRHGAAALWPLGLIALACLPSWERG